MMSPRRGCSASAQSFRSSIRSGYRQLCSGHDWTPLPSLAIGRCPPQSFRQACSRSTSFAGLVQDCSCAKGCSRCSEFWFVVTYATQAQRVILISCVCLCRAQASISGGPVKASERSLVLARAQELKLLEEEKRRLESIRAASQLKYAASIPLPPSPKATPPAGKSALEALRPSNQNADNGCGWDN